MVDVLNIARLKNLTIRHAQYQICLHSKESFSENNRKCLIRLILILIGNTKECKLNKIRNAMKENVNRSILRLEKAVELHALTESLL